MPSFPNYPVSTLGLSLRSGFWKQKQLPLLPVFNKCCFKFNMFPSVSLTQNKIHGQTYVYACFTSLIVERIKPTLIWAVNLSPQHSGANVLFPSLCWCKLAVCNFNFWTVIQNEILGSENILWAAIKTPNELFI